MFDDYYYDEEQKNEEIGYHFLPPKKRLFEEEYSGIEQLEAYLPHKQKVEGSSPSPAPSCSFLYD